MSSRFEVITGRGRVNWGSRERDLIGPLIVLLGPLPALALRQLKVRDTCWQWLPSLLASQHRHPVV